MYSFKQKLSDSVPVRIAFPAILTILLFVTAIFFIILPALEQSFMDRKREMIRELTESAWSILAAFEKQESDGLLSRNDAQNQAIAQIRSLRYGPERKDYFWINDMVPNMIMHPYRPDLEGKDISGFQDPKGKHLFESFVGMVEKQGAGYVDYMWQWKDDPDKIVPKLSYIKGFAPWNWVIGSGIYIEDVRSEIAVLRGKLAGICSIILMVVSLMAFYIIRQTVLADRLRKNIWDEKEGFYNALQTSEERFRALVETTSDWIWEMDNKGVYTYASPKLTDLLGYEPEDLIGKTILDIMPDDSIQPSAEKFNQIIRSKEPFTGLEITCLTITGLPVVIEKNGVPVFDAGKHITGFRGIARDITERKKAEQALKQSRDQLHRSLEETVKSLSSTVEKRDPYTAGHQLRVDRLACAIARELGLAEKQIEGLHFAAVLHDIGKISLPSEFLTKPTQLTREEKSVIRCHAEVGYDILKNIHFPWPVAEIVYQHHEFLDGSGYPRKLTDKEILLEAKILTVADVVEAMSTHRPYRSTKGMEASLNEILSGRGIRYHAQSVDACIDLIKNKKFNFLSAE